MLVLGAGIQRKGPVDRERYMSMCFILLPAGRLGSLHPTSQF